jgi:pimeloyl-ACP methyl ester carboxylesterase
LLFLIRKYNSPYSTSTSSRNLLAIEEIIFNKLLKENPQITGSLINEMFDIEIENSQTFSVKSHSVIFSPLCENNLGSIVFIHGANSGPLVWFECAILLAKKGYLVHCIALPGFGSSKVSIDILSLQTKYLLSFLSSYIKKYIELHTTNISRPYIVGHSLGGFLASSFVLRFPYLCKSFVLVNSAGIFPINGNNSWFWATIFYFGIPNYFTKKIGFFLNSVIFSYYSYYNNFDPITHWYIANMNCNESFGELIVSRFTEFPTVRWKLYFFTELITSDEVPPFSMIWGEDDTIVPISICKNLSMFCSGIPIIYITDTWHTPMSKVLEFVDAIIICINSANRPKKQSIDKVFAIENALNKCYASIYKIETENRIKIMFDEIFDIIDLN